MKKLGEVLSERGWVSRSDVMRALNHQRRVGGRLGTCLLEMGLVSEERLVRALADQHRVEAVDVDDLRQVPEDLQGALPVKVALRCRAVPVRATTSKLTVAMMDPGDLACQDELSFASSRRLVIGVASEVRLREAMERYYGEALDGRFTRILDQLNRRRNLGKEGGESAAAAHPGGEPESGRIATGRPLFPEAPDLTPPPLPRPDFEKPPTTEAAPPPAAAAASAAASSSSTAVSTVPAVSAPASSVAAPPASAADSPAAALATPTSGAATGADPQGAPGAEPEPAAAPAAPRTRPTKVTLSESERATLFGGRAPAPLSYEEAEQRLREIDSRDVAGRLVLDFLRQEFDRVLLFAVRKDATTGWMADGDGLETARLERLHIPFDRPSLFLNLRHGSAFHLGPLPPMPAHRPLVELLGGEAPEECLVLPVRIGDRMVAAIWCDRGGEHLGGADLEALRHLADIVADTLERCILLKRQGPT